MSQTRQLAAIMFTDIVGYTALMGRDEEKAFELLKRNREIHKPLIKQFHGTWIKEIGDGVLASFHTVTDAVFCAAAIHETSRPVDGLQFRIGIHLGEVIFENHDVFGDGVNIASRLQAMASIGSTWVSEAVYKNLINKKEIISEFVKEEHLKNVIEPVRVYEIHVKEIPGFLPGNKKTFSAERGVDAPGKKKRIFISAIILLAVLASLYFIFLKKQVRSAASVSETIEKSIAVIPFKNMSTDPNQEYFVEGMMDEVLNHLYKIGGLNVISRTTSMAYKDSKKTSKEIAKELGVANLLGGSVQKDGDHIKIIIQLIDGKTDNHIWAETYVREFKDVFAIQSDIAQEVAAALKVKIDPEVSKRIEAEPTKNIEAYNLYLQAIRIDSFTGVQPKYLLERALALDPEFANAYSYLALYWIFQGGHEGSLSADEVLNKAVPLNQKALNLNPDLESAHLVSALINLYYKLDFNAVETEFRNIFQLNPSDPNTTLLYSDYLLATGKFREALDIMLRSFEKDKNSYRIMANLALSYFHNDQPQRALELINSASNLFENDFVTLNAIRIKNYAGKYQEAIQEYIKNPSFYNKPAIPYILGHMSVAYYNSGQPEKAGVFLDSLIAKSKISSIGSPKFFIAAAYTAMGKKDIALDWLEKSHADKEVERYWIKVEPLFRSLHSEPRFQNLLKTMGFD